MKILGIVSLVMGIQPVCAQLQLCNIRKLFPEFTSKFQEKRRTGTAADRPPSLVEAPVDLIVDLQKVILM